MEVSHGGVINQFPTSNQPASWIAWYSDVAHQIKPITAGYRLVLVVDMVQTVTVTAGQTYGAGFDTRYPSLGEAL